MNLPDPQERVRDRIAAGEINSDRPARIAPPPARRPAAPVASRTAALANVTSQVDEAAVPPTPPDRASVSRATPRALPPTRPRSMAPRYPTAGMVPAPIVRELRHRIALARIEGRRLVFEAVVAEAIEALPTMASAVAAELGQHEAALNIGKRLGDIDHVPAEKVSARLTESARRRVEELVAHLEFEHNTRIDRQDLWALALIRWLASH